MSELDESRARLEKEVAELKRAKASGTREREKTLYDHRMEMRALDNIVTPGDALAPMVARFAALAEEAKVFFADLRKKIAETPPTFCEEHEDVELPIDEERTNYQSWQSKSLRIVHGKCPACNKAFTDALVNEKWRKMGIPEKLYGCTLENFETNTEAQKKALIRCELQIKDERGFMLLRGKVGTGKSHLAVGIIKRFSEGIFVTEADLVAELRETYTNNSGQEKMVAKYRKSKVMVLDELTLEVKGVDIPQLLYRILGSRYNDNLLTVITSNEPLETILEILGPRLTDRVKENHRIATLEGDSYRKPIHE